MVESVEALVSHFISWAASASRVGPVCSVTEAALQVIHERLHMYLDVLDPGETIYMDKLDMAALKEVSNWLCGIAETFEAVFEEYYELDDFGRACVVAVRTMCFSAGAAIDRAFAFGQREEAA